MKPDFRLGLNLLNKFRKRIPWQIKLIALMLTLAILPSIFVSYSVSNLIREELTSNINTQLNYSTNSVSAGINSRIKKTKEIIELLTKTIENPLISSEQKLVFIASNTEKIDNILSLSVLINEGSQYSVAVTSSKDFLKKRDGKLVPFSSTLEIFKNAYLSNLQSDSLIITTPKYNKKLEAWLSWFVRKIKLPNAPDAFLVSLIDLSEISTEVEEHLLNRIGNLLVVDHSANKFLSSRFSLDLPEQLLSDALTVLKGEKDISLVKKYSSGESEFVASVAAAKEVNWIVISYITTKSAYAIVDEAIVFFGLFVGLSALLSIVIAVWFSKHISKPIIKMANTSQLIADGNFDVEIEYKAKDSIGLLNNSLSKMGLQLKKNFQEIEQQKNQLEDYSKNLEKKVEERTNELNESNRELKKAYQRVLELNEEKNEFLGIAAHDLKNPLTAVSAFADILKQDRDLTTEQHDDFLDEIIKASNRMFFIVKNLLDVNAIEQGKLNTQLQSVSLKAIVKEMVAQFAEATSKKNIVMHELYESEEVNVIADYNLMSQIVQNILSNAIKFSPSGKNIFITVKSSSQKDILELRIKDEGPGFTDDDKKKLFKKFSRLSARPTAGEHSTGLGLSIVKKLVEMMNGSIELESESGKGAEFIISLPRAKGEDIAEA